MPRIPNLPDIRVRWNRISDIPQRHPTFYALMKKILNKITFFKTFLIFIIMYVHGCKLQLFSNQDFFGQSCYKRRCSIIYQISETIRSSCPVSSWKVDIKNQNKKIYKKHTIIIIIYVSITVYTVQ